MGREISDDELDDDDFTPTCETCDHFAEPAEPWSSIGTCRRYPPRFVERIEAPVIEGRSAWDHGRRPPVAQFEVCGEWSNRDAAWRAEAHAVATGLQAAIAGSEATLWARKALGLDGP